MLEVFLAVMSLVAMTLMALIVWHLKKRQPVNAAADVVTEEIAKQVVSELAEKLDALKNYDKMIERRTQLETELIELRKQRDTIQETFDRKQRELEHAAGLARNQLEAELEHGRIKADLDAQKKVIDAERKYNEQALAAQKESFDKQMERTQEITEQLFKLVPNIEARLRLKGSA